MELKPLKTKQWHNEINITKKTFTAGLLKRNTVSFSLFLSIHYSRSNCEKEKPVSHNISKTESKTLLSTNLINKNLLLVHFNNP